MRAEFCVNIAQFNEISLIFHDILNNEMRFRYTNYMIRNKTHAAPKNDRNDKVYGNCIKIFCNSATNLMLSRCFCMYVEEVKSQTFLVFVHISKYIIVLICLNIGLKSNVEQPKWMRTFDIILNSSRSFLSSHYLFFDIHYNSHTANCPTILNECIAQLCKPIKFYARDFMEHAFIYNTAKTPTDTNILELEHEHTIPQIKQHLISLNYFDLLFWSSFFFNFTGFVVNLT